MKYVVLILILVFFLFIYFIGENKIDIVYTWVDGNDENWIKKKNKYSSNRNKIDDATRFTSIDELKYSLRSVYKYANWVNNIYIVVDDDQKPKWLNLKHPKIHLIKHSQIFPDINDLPTFNSQSIECHLHRIPKLSEYFIYLNDDMFFGNYMYKNDFINRNKMNYFLNNNSNCIFDLNKIEESKYNSYFSSWNNTQKLLKDNYNLVPSCQWHFGLILKKSHFVDMKNKFNKEFKYTSKSRFRDKYKEIVPNGLAYRYGLYINDYIINKDKKGIYIDCKGTDKYLINSFNNIKIIKPHMFCINNISKYNPIIINFLNNYYPDKSPYEI